MVQGVHHFETYLDIAALVQGEVLEERGVGAPVARTAQRVSRQVPECALCRTAKGAAGGADGGGVEPLVACLRAVRIADQVRPVRTGIAIRPIVAVTDIEWQSALDDHVGVELPAAGERFGYRREIRTVLPTAAERQLGDDRCGEVVYAIPVRRSIVEVAVVQPLVFWKVRLEILTIVGTHALQRVVGLRRVSSREALGQARLQRVVSVGCAVAEVVDALRPAELVEERPPLIPRYGRVAVDRRLIDVEGRSIASEDVRAMVTDVADLERERRGDLPLHGDVVGVDGRRPLRRRQRPREDSILELESPARRDGRKNR